MPVNSRTTNEPLEKCYKTDVVLLIRCVLITNMHTSLSKSMATRDNKAPAPCIICQLFVTDEKYSMHL